MRHLIALPLVLALSVPAFAGFEGPGNTGGFSGPDPANVTQAAQVQKARDDAPCTLEGALVERIGKDKYTFRDASGAVTVEIDDHVFGGKTVTPQSRIRLVGEVEDKKYGRPHEVDVRYLEILN